MLFLRILSEAAKILLREREITKFRGILHLSVRPLIGTDLDPRVAIVFFPTVMYDNGVWSQVKMSAGGMLYFVLVTIYHHGTASYILHKDLVALEDVK